MVRGGWLAGVTASMRRPPICRTKHMKNTCTICVINQQCTSFTICFQALPLTRRYTILLTYQFHTTDIPPFITHYFYIDGSFSPSFGNPSSSAPDVGALYVLLLPLPKEDICLPVHFIVPLAFFKTVVVTLSNFALAYL